MPSSSSAAAAGLQETRGEPDALIVSHLPYGPTAHFSLSGAVMRHDIEGRGTVSEAYPHLIFQVGLPAWWFLVVRYDALL